jgi:glutamine amidotransferase
MCRHLAYWGPPVAVADLIVGSPHSLFDQCTDARQQASGNENPDGWGLGWYVEGQPQPYRYRTATPMPLDPDGVAAIDGLEVGRFVAHIRHKSPGSPTDAAGNAPFIEGPWLFAHNGFVADYFAGEAEAMRATLSSARRERLPGKADSELLFGLVLDRIDGGADPIDAMAEVIESHSGPGRDRGRFNLLLTDGEQLLASRWGNSLHLRIDEAPGRRSVVVASEPFDNRPGWDAVPDHTMLRIDAAGVELIPH